MDIHDEIKYRNDLAKMNLNKTYMLSQKKNITKEEIAKANKCSINAAYHELKIRAILGDPVYCLKTDKELYKMAEEEFDVQMKFLKDKKFYKMTEEELDECYSDVTFRINLKRLINFVKSFFKKKDKR